jgi:PAS domain S-box-containing protein
VLGKEIHGIIAMYQEDREVAYKGMERFTKTGEGSILRTLREVDAKKKDGTSFPAEISINAVQIDDEWWAVGIVRDISDRRRSEKEIREMAQFPLEISNTIMRVDDESTLLFANPASEFLLRNLGMKVGRKVAQPLRDLVRDAIRKNERIETRSKIAERIYLFTAFPIPQSGYVNIYGADITEEENVRRSVEASELKYRSLVNAMPQYMFHKDLQGRYITVNDALAKLMGVDSARVPGKSDLDLFAKEAAAIHKESDKEVIKNKLPIEFDEPLDLEKPDGNVIHMVKAPIINANGDVEGVLGIFWDITNRIKAERELASLNRNLEALVKDRTREIETINDRLSISEKK